MTKIEQKIPEGWSVTFLENLTKHVKYGIVDGPFGSNLKSEHYRIMGIPVIQSGFVTSQKFIANNYLYVDEALFEREKRSATHAEDIIMAKIGAQAGTCALLPKGHPEAILAGNCLKITINPILANNTYILEILHNKYEKDGFIDIKSVTAQPAISLTNLKKLKLLLPPLPEQEKIAGILSCWDDGIEKLLALIEKKKIQKKALMQQLLTGKHRLKGFSSPWREVKLGDIFSIKKGQRLSKEELNPLGKNACILYGELYTTYNEVIYNIKSLTNVDRGITSQVGDILIPASTTTTGIDLANATALMVSGVLLGGDINILRCKIQSSPIFFAYLLTHIYKYEIAKLAQGMTIVHLYGEFIKKIKVFIPTDLAEQNAIAEILSKADEEIELLNKKLEAFKQEKKALMQQLLTGKIRVKVN